MMNKEETINLDLVDTEDLVDSDLDDKGDG